MTIGESTQMRPGYRQPPHSREAEESVIGALLLSVDAVNEVMDRIHPEDFYVPAHQAIFESMKELFDSNQAIDAITVSESLRRRGELEKVGGVQYLTRLVDIVPSTSNVVYYAGIVEEHAKRRELIRAGASVTEFAFSIDEEIAAVLDRAEQAVLGVAEKRSSQTLLEVGPMFQDVLEHIEMLEQQGSDITGLATGFVDLDKKLAGLQAANLVVIAGRPAMGKCLGGATRVVDPETGQLTRIDQLQGVGKVLALDPKELALAPEKRTAWLDQDLQETFRVTTRLGRWIVATSNHPFLTINGWCELRQLSVGDEVAVAGLVETESAGPELSDAEVALLGYMIGDGTCTTRTPLFTNTNPEILDDLARWAAQLDLELSQDLGMPQYRLRRRSGKGRENELTTLLKVHGVHGCTAHDKRVPDAIFRAPRKQIALFLNRLYACDGSAWIDKDNYRIEYCTVSEQLADDIQHLLLRFGIVAKKRRRMVSYRGERRQAFDVSFQDSDSVEKFVGYIGAFGKMERMADVLQIALNRKVNAAAHELLPMSVWDLVLAEKGERTWRSISLATGRPKNHNWHVHRRRLSKRLLGEIAKALNSDRLMTLSKSSIVWDPIVSIEPAGVQPTYDLTVDTHHNFVANDIVVHNSSLALNIATNAAADGETVAIFSLEMSKEEIVQRILSSVGKVDSMKLRSGQLGPLWQRVVDAAGRMYKAPVFIDDSPVVTVTDIRAKCRRLKRKKGLALIVVDYLQLMEASGNENRQQEIAQISRNLKNLARELEVPIIAVSQLNRSLESREDKRPRLADLRESGCLTADTRLIRADTNAEVTLGELVESGVTDVPVWSLDEQFRLVRSNLTHAFQSGTKPIFEMRLASGRVLTATDNHPFLTLDGWTPLGDLAEGDRIAVARVIPQSTSSQVIMSDDHIVLLAHMIGDGCHLARHGMQYTTTDLVSAELVSQAARRSFGIEPRLKRERGWYQLYLPSPHHLTHGRRIPLAEWLDDLGIFDKRSHEVFVPEVVFSFTRDQVALFLRHLWATDGCVWSTDTQSRVYYATSGRRLADGVQSLLTRLDIRSRLVVVSQRGGRDQYHVDVSGRDDQLRFLEEVGVAGARGEQADVLRERLQEKKANTNVDSIPAQVWDYVRTKAMPAAGVSGRELARRLEMSYCGSTLYQSGVSRARMSRLAEALDDSYLAALATSDVLWDRVVSITPKGTAPVFDATVEETHNFLANGVVAHNSIEQDADVVMFVYRHEYYHPEEQDKKGIAEVIVAKHRAGSTGPVEMTFQPEFTRFANLGRDVT
jgi:replicative DNA helicase